MTFFKEGKWIEYYIDGTKMRVIKYKQGEIVKVIKKWDKEGSIEKMNN